jgi:hypothetical protein
MYGACWRVICEKLVFSPTITNVWPNRGTAACADAASAKASTAAAKAGADRR